MEQPVQITFHDVEATDAIKSAIEERVGHLERFYDKIASCRVVIESPHRHQNKGRIYHVKIKMTVPGDELVISREPEQHGAHEDLYVAINDAFKEARRQLEHYVERRRRV